MTKVQFHELIYYTCKRPTMYTPTGSFFEVVSFLEGLGAGAGIENDGYHSKFAAFRCWMAGRLNKGNRFPISWVEFADLYSTESEAINALPSLYNEFLEANRVVE